MNARDEFMRIISEAKQWDDSTAILGRVLNVISRIDSGEIVELGGRPNA